MKWNSDKYHWWYDHVLDEAMSNGLTGEELQTQTLDNRHLRTESKRISHMIKLAYYLGRLKQVRWMDEGLNRIYPSGEKHE